MQLAILWRVTGEAKYLQALEAWIPTMEAFQPLRVKKIGGVGNHDLTAGGLLCGFAAAYDLLKGKAGSHLETAVRRVLVGQAKQLYADLVAIPSYPYEQNHLTIPVCGMAVAALATCDELPEAQAWLVFSHNVLDRCLKAVAYDGWFFEGVSYWNFTMEYPLLYAAALRRTTGEDLFRGQFFGNTALYLAHTFLPGSRFVFDFVDWGPRVNSDGTTAQRGYHLNLRSPATAEFRFLTAMGIQSLEDPEERFPATATSPHQLDLRDGPVSCRIWIDPQPGLDGTFAFLVREGTQVTAIGLSGRRLDTAAGRIEIPNGGQVILRPKTNAASGWTAECEPSLKWTIQSKRKS